ncbi:PREDICTED: uncharacterized protein LOC108778087 [Cyphomyrmex costatus]|uniref:PB1 domain-containing protein n=1 Tax=Cyphomyrmex costatus TaxID=456900 RepID=A0A195CCW1_9HYME|nr:PREDICTED: uncharacterized protein LOC108778087 [Cyphomyrmex costatus]KYM98056.1 hypothetical protein ALC62_11402 [Cyphomyrmex costatus]
MSTTSDSEEYYSFVLKENFSFVLKENFSLSGQPFPDNQNTIVIPRSHNINLRNMRTVLWKQFGVPRDRRIFYIDDDGDRVPIDSECEFDEALKLAKKAFMLNAAIPLMVGSINISTDISRNDEQSFEMNEIHCSNKESTNINGNPILSFNEKSDGSMSEPNLESDKRKRPTQKVLNQKKLNVKHCDKSSEEQTEEEEDIKVPLIPNTSLRCHSDMVPPPWFTEYMETMKKDMVPPPWFTEYMETMKKDMVSTIIKKVVENVTVVLNERLDSLAYLPLKELSQSRSQSYSSLSKRHSKCPFDSNEMNQKRMKSQDEEQSSDASIERVDEPQNVNISEDLQTKKDMITTISQEVVKEMTEMLNRMPLDLPTSVPSKKHGQSRNQSHLSSSKRFSRYFDSHSSEKNQRKMRPQDGEQSSDDASIEHMYESRNVNTADVLRQKKFDLIEDVICASLKEEKRKKKYHQRMTPVTTNNINSDGGKEQSRNNAWEDVVPRKNLVPPHVDLPYDETKEMLEDELRMSCSVTGHQILNEGRRRDTWCSDTDKTSFCSCDQEEEDVDAFEIIQMPTLGSRDESFTHVEAPATEQRRHDSNRDSPSFELLSESPSPTPTCYMHFNEEHFSANEENSEEKTFNFCDYGGSTYVIDIHGRIYTDYQLAKRNWQTVNADMKKRIDKVSKKISQTLDENPFLDRIDSVRGRGHFTKTKTVPLLTELGQNTRCSKSFRLDRLNKWNFRDDVGYNTRNNASSSYDDVERPSKWNFRDDVGYNTRDNASNSYDDVRNSHTSYLTVQTHCDCDLKLQSQCNCKSQTDLNDFTQSFHSHTTSVTDTTDITDMAYGNDRYDEQVSTAKNVRETGTGTAKATATSKNDHDMRFGSNYMKETWTKERHYHDANNYPKYFCTSHNNTPQEPSIDPPYQSAQSSESSDRSSSNAGSKKTFIGETLGTADPVHILPETLVNAAAHVGSIAYNNVRDKIDEALDKIRARRREVPVKRRSLKNVKHNDRVPKRCVINPLS